MKCRACDEILTDREAVAKDKSGEFNDLCFPCLNKSQDFQEEVLEIEEEDAPSPE